MRNHVEVIFHQALEFCKPWIYPWHAGSVIYYCWTWQRCATSFEPASWEPRQITLLAQANDCLAMGVSRNSSGKISICVAYEKRESESQKLHSKAPLLSTEAAEPMRNTDLKGRESNESAAKDVWLSTETGSNRQVVTNLSTLGKWWPRHEAGPWKGRRWDPCDRSASEDLKTKNSIPKNLRWAQVVWAHRKHGI